MSGATLPGAPSVILGRTKGVAWGFTNTGPDVQDLYIEEINERGEARTPDGWQSLPPQRNLQGQGAKRTHRSPCASHATGRSFPMSTRRSPPPSIAKKFAVALRWTALDADNLSVLAAPP